MVAESVRAGFLVKQKYRGSNEFMNKRKDLYGGNIRNRIRFHQKVIGAVREGVGDEALILLRLGAANYRKFKAKIINQTTAEALFHKKLK